MATNTASFDIHTKIKFFREPLQIYMRHFYHGIDRNTLHVVVPDFLGFMIWADSYMFTGTEWKWISSESLNSTESFSCLITDEP